MAIGVLTRKRCPFCSKMGRLRCFHTKKKGEGLEGFRRGIAYSSSCLDASQKCFFFVTINLEGKEGQMVLICAMAVLENPMLQLPRNEDKA